MIEKRTFFYFRETLSDVEKVAYDLLVNGFMEYRYSITLYGLSFQQIENIYQKIKQDVPLIFFVEKITVQYIPLVRKAIVIPKYRFAKNEVHAIIVALQDKVNDIVQICMGKCDKDKEIVIHDFLCSNVRYDENFKKSSFECVGPLLFGNGVCEGIAKAAKLLFDAVGMESLIVHGESREQFVNSDNDTLHTWNMVRLNEYYFHLDITFDLTVMDFDVIRYDYFNLSDKDIMLDHFFEPVDLPICSYGSNYYIENNMYMETQQAFNEYLKECLKQGKRDIVIQLPYILDINKAKDKVIDIARKCIGQNTNNIKQYHLSYNESQRVFQLHIL